MSEEIKEMREDFFFSGTLIKDTKRTSKKEFCAMNLQCDASK